MVIELIKRVQLKSRWMFSVLEKCVLDCENIKNDRSRGKLKYDE